jgi:transcription termination factor NusB
MGGRRQGREHALQMLFQWDISKGSFNDVRNTFWTLKQESASNTRAFADQLA